MKRLGKYLIIVYLVLTILTILSYSSSIVYKNYTKSNIPEAQYDSQGNQMVSSIPTDTPSFYLMQGIGFFLFFGFPIFIIVMSALYLYKEKEGYFKSLLIPVSYAIFGVIVSFIWLFNFASGEEGMAILYILLMLSITVIASLIVNGIVLAIIRK